MSNNTIRLLEWDSHFFGRKIGSIFDIKNIIESEFRHYDLICNKVEASDFYLIDKLISFDFKFIEGEVIFRKNLNEYDLDVKPFNINIATESDIGLLAKISKKSFVFSRFREPYFSIKQKNNVYRLWLQKAIEGTFDDICLIIRDGESIQGFITLKKHENTMKVGLLAVSHNYKRQGVGSQLINLAESYSVLLGCEDILIATQLSNTPAMKLYSKTGYIISKVNYWFYKNIK